MRFARLLAILLTISLTSVWGCQRLQQPAGMSLSEAHKKFLQICRDEYGLTPVLKPLDNTVWIYIAMKEPILDLKAKDTSPAKSDKATEKQVINYLNGIFEDKTFKLKYDISPAKKYAEDLGYHSIYTEKYQENQRGLFTTITRAYSSVESVPGDVTYLDPARQDKHKALVDAHIKTEKVQDFFFIVISDITKGIEMKTIAYFQDLKKGTTDYSFYEEYAKRLISKQPIGDPSIIGDKEGKHLKITDLTWPEFLTEQILHRIKFKYQQSSFPPSNDTEKEILKVVHETVSAYSFKDFRSVELNDLATEQTYLFDKKQLETFK